MALHRCSFDAEAQIGFDTFEKPFFVFAASAGITDDADCMAGCRLRVAKVADVAEDPAYRRAEAVDDAERAHLRDVCRSEQALAHIDRIAGQQWIADRDTPRHHLAIDL